MEKVREKRIITLIITERCDLACVYCYEHDKSSKQMTFNTAKSIIDKNLIDLDKYEYQIEFFGGEPFLNFALIKQVVLYVLSHYKGYYHFFITTNGTQVHNDIQKWLISHKNIVTVGLSADGNEIAHNLNRSNSFNKIDFDFFLKNYPEQTIKMTISELSLPYLADSIIYLTEKGFKISCNLAYMVDWLSPRNFNILEQQLNLLINYYLENPYVDKCSLFDFKLELLAHPEKDRNKFTKYCGCGTHMACFDINGEKYPCQLFSPLSAGKKAIKSQEFIIDISLDKVNLPEYCRKCYYLRICQICLGSNYLSTGNMYSIDENRCALYKIIYKANAKLKALEWEKNIINTDDEQGLLKAIVDIQKN